MNFSHQDLQNQYWTNPGETGGGKQSNGIDDDGNGYVDDWRGWDFYQDDNDPTDLNGHGTGRAGILAAEQNNSLGISGVAPGVKIMVLRTSNSILHRPDRVAAAIRYATDNGARVINMALGAVADTPVLRDAMTYAEANGVVPVVAMANEFSQHTNIPTVYDEAVGAGAIVPNSIGSTASDFTVKAAYSNYGPLVDVVAPSSVYETSLGGGYDHGSGTSSATPGIAGVAALVIAAAQDNSITLSEQEVVQIVRMSADGLVGGPYHYVAGWDRYTGWGRVDAANAVAMVTSGNIPPVADITGPAWYSRQSGTVYVTGAVSARTSPYQWTLSIGKGNQPASFTTVATGSGSSPFNGQLGSFDASSMSNGLYTLKLDVTDGTNNLGEDRQAFSIRNDPSIMFRTQLAGSVSGGPVFANIDGQAGDELIVADGTGYVHAFRANGTEAPGWPVSTPQIAWHGLTYHQGFIGGPSVGDLLGNGQQDVVIGGLDGYVYAWDPGGNLLSGWPQATSTAVDPSNQTYDAGVYGTPALANLDGNPGLEVIVGAGNGKVYAWHADGTPVSGWPVLLQDPAKPFQANPVVSSPAVGDLDNDGTMDVVIGSEEHYGSSTRLYVLEPDGSYKTGWPRSLNVFSSSGLPLVATGIALSPVLADVNGDGNLEIGISAFTGGYFLFNANGTSATFSAGLYGPGSNAADSGTIDSTANLAVGDLNADGKPDLVAGGAGLGLLNASTNDGKVPHFNHLVVAFNGNTKKYFRAWPRVSKDWMFLNGPILADVDGDGRPEVIMGNGIGQLDAFRLDGTEAMDFPKQVGQWIQGSAAAGDMAGNHHVEVAVGTRLGMLIVYNTRGRPKGLQWPDFHGDPAGTGVYTP
jgi:Subtilase family/FG-GAP-like repeat